MMNPLGVLDDILIDRVFQPFCDMLRKNFGLSRKFPEGVVALLGAALLCPLEKTLLTFPEWIPRLCAVVIALAILTLGAAAYFAFREEFFGQQEKTSFSSVLQNDRVRLESARRTGMGYIIAFIPLQGMFYVVGGITPQVGFWRFSGYTAAVMSFYFCSCSDLPPGEKMSVRIRRELGRWRLRLNFAP